MARNVSDEELQLKKRARRRLVGAIVLVTAVAVLLPMILDSEPKQVSQDINIQIPSPDSGALAVKPKPLKQAEPAPAATAEIKPAPQPEPKTEVKAEPKPEAKPAAKAEPKPAPKPKAVTKPGETGTDKAAADRGFVIQVVALADAARAQALQQQIAGSGLKAYTEVVQTANGPVTRVRVGPYPSREAAEQARKQLQSLQLDGKVIPR